MVTLQVTKNDYGQEKRNGVIILKADTVMINRANDGLAYWDKRWQRPSNMTVPAGTEVDYTFLETQSGNYHTVTYRCASGVFYATIGPK